MNKKEFIEKLNTEILFLSRKQFSMFSVQYEIYDINDKYITILVCIPTEYHITMEQISRNIKKSIRDFYPNIPVNTNLFKFIDSDKWNDLKARKFEIDNNFCCRIMISDNEHLIKAYSE